MATLIAGELFAGKRLISLLGQGFFSEVWLVLHEELGAQRALKVMNEAVIKPKLVARFYKEARAMSDITHNNVVKVIDVGVFEGRPFLVMEYHESVDLRHLIYDGELTPIRSLEIIADVLRALVVVHERNIIHRDIKPENVLVGTDGVTRLTDFGIAQVQEGDSRMTQAQDVMGTLRYMAPEQKGSSLQVMIESDLYAVGVMIFELLGGELPTDPRLTLDLFVAEIRVKKLAGFQVGVRQLLERALQYSPENRYRSAEEMLGAVQALRKHLEKEQRATTNRSAVISEPPISYPQVEVMPTPAQPVVEVSAPEVQAESDPFANLPEQEERGFSARYVIGAIFAVLLVASGYLIMPSADDVVQPAILVTAETPDVVVSTSPIALPSLVTPIEPAPVKPSLPVETPVNKSPRLSLGKKSTAEIVPNTSVPAVQPSAVDQLKLQVGFQHQAVTSLDVPTLSFKAVAVVGSKISLRYRSPDSPWQEPVSLKEVRPGVFEATLSSSDFVVTGIDYFLEAKFPDGNSQKTSTFKVR